MIVPKEIKCLGILVDGPILEVLNGDGLVYGTFELTEKTENVWKLCVRQQKR